MKNIIVQEMVTVDGFFAGPGGEIDWHVVDSEFNEYAVGVLKSVDTLIFGRVTYEMMANYWPMPAALKDDPIVAERMNNLFKIVFSKAGNETAWNNTKALNDINAADILKMKQEPGKDMIIFGSGTIVSEFTRLGLVDEYLFIVNPVILGKGKTLFPGITASQKLKLVKTRQFSSGNVLLQYKPS